MPTQVFFDAQGREIGRNMGKVSAGEILARLGVASPGRTPWGFESLVAALLGGLLTSAAPCMLAAMPVAVGYVGGQATTPRRASALSLAFVVGMNVALLALGLLAARLGLLLGALPGPWSIVVGVVVARQLMLAMAHQGRVVRPASAGGIRASARAIGHGRRGGARRVDRHRDEPLCDACAWGCWRWPDRARCSACRCYWRVALLLAYGLGHGVLLLLAGAMPSAASVLAHRLRSTAGMDPWAARIRARHVCHQHVVDRPGTRSILTRRFEIMNKLPERRFHLVFSLLMGAMIIFVMTFVITMVNVGCTGSCALDARLPDCLRRRHPGHLFPGTHRATS